MKKILVSVWLALACAFAWALPTVQQVQAEVQQGHYSQAEGMMREVVDAKPDSAKAHYIYAEILAHNGNFAKAADEAGAAKRLDPEIKFTQADKFEAFQKLLERQRKPAQPSPSSNLLLPSVAAATPLHSQTPGIPNWVWLAALGAVGFLLWRGLSRSQAAAGQGGAYGVPTTASASGYTAGPMGSNGMVGPYASAPPAVSPAGGLLKTGLAVAGGVAAGMMVDELLHRRQGAGTDQVVGVQPGLFDTAVQDDAAYELEHRGVDFGNGNDWDSGGAGADYGGTGTNDGGWD